MTELYNLNELSIESYAHFDISINSLYSSLLFDNHKSLLHFQYQCFDGRIYELEMAIYRDMFENEWQITKLVDEN